MGRGGHNGPPPINVAAGPELYGHDDQMAARLFRYINLEHFGGILVSMTPGI